MVGRHRPWTEVSRVPGGAAGQEEPGDDRGDEAGSGGCPSAEDGSGRVGTVAGHEIHSFESGVRIVRRGRVVGAWTRSDGTAQGSAVQGFLLSVRVWCAAAGTLRRSWCSLGNHHGGAGCWWTSGRCGAHRESFARGVGRAPPDRAGCFRLKTLSASDPLPIRKPTPSTGHMSGLHSSQTATAAAGGPERPDGSRHAPKTLPPTATKRADITAAVTAFRSASASRSRPGYRDPAKDLRAVCNHARRQDEGAPFTRSGDGRALRSWSNSIDA